MRQLEDLEPFDDHAQLKKIVESIPDLLRRNAVHDVFELLNAGDVKTAQTRVALLRGNLSIPKPDDKVKNGESLRLIPTDSPQYAKLFEHFVRTADYRDWMVFMHPEQETVAEAEYAGPAKLTGVSGSGKTCIVVKRAIVLARRYPDERILVLTLNRPLASLIEELVSVTCDDSRVRERIQVIPFFHLCQELLKGFEPENTKLYDDVTWKSKEHIDEVWREYYRCEVNVRDAACMLPVHDSLISRGIDAESYIREEFDWIRSALSFDERGRYADVDRTGRSHPLSQRFRELLLEGLSKWETKMRFVGVTDYLGIATALFRFQEQLSPRYRCVLIDECQDFGTIELKLITRLVMEGPDNIFFCGDAAQRVSWKHQSLVGAGVVVPGARSRRIEQNYRNSRDVLKAAYSILYDNLTEEMMNNEDFEILDPKYANFGGSVPLLLEANSLAEEISYAIAYARSESAEGSGHKACIAICGHSLYEIQEFGKSIGIPVLDGTLDLAKSSLFLSDLEHTKGFEFDLICVVNVSDGQIPDSVKPELERSRDLAKLYVAMTRAKLQLVLSYNGAPSVYVEKTDELLKGKWTEFVAEEDMFHFGAPKKLEHLRKTEGDAIAYVGLMTGEQFLYTRDALGLSSRLIDKLRTLISGRKRIEGSTPVEWRDISEAARDSGRYARARQQFGPETIHDFFSLLEKHGLRPRRAHHQDNRRKNVPTC